MTVACAPSTVQAVTVNGVRIENPTLPENRVSLERVLGSKRAPIRISNNSNTPYRCIGEVIYVLQADGYGRVSFIAEPPSP